MITTAALFFAVSTAAVPAQTVTAPPCEGAAHHQLDFWVGDWAVFQQGDDLVAILELPGIDKNGLQLEAKNNTIRISGKKEIVYDEGTSVHRRERHSGTFDRTLTVPIQIDADRVKAEYRDGVLALFIPRAESDKPRTISIN